MGLVRSKFIETEFGLELALKLVSREVRPHAVTCNAKLLGKPCLRTVRRQFNFQQSLLVTSPTGTSPLMNLRAPAACPSKPESAAMPTTAASAAVPAPGEGQIYCLAANWL
jgi:hypothetical protein